MNTILFQSLFNDLDLTTLKHCIFYFDSIEIPTISVPIAWGETNQNVRYLQSVPENVYDVINFLKDEGVVDLVVVKDVSDRNLHEVYDLILGEIDSIGADRNYSADDIKEICNFIDIKPDDPERLKIVDKISIFLASVCIMSLSLKEQVCCIDNKLVFDSINFGIKRIINSRFQPNNIGEFEINKLKSNILAQKVIALNLPSFKFHTFEDVLELKSKYRDNLLSLNNHLLDISKDLEGMPWDLDFSDKIDDLIKRKIQPEIMKLRKNVKTSAGKIANLIYDTGFSNLALTYAFYRVHPNHLKEIILGVSAKILFEVMKSFYYDRADTLSNSPFNIFMKVI